MKEYDHGEIEQKWHKEWEKDGSMRAIDGADIQKTYLLVEFPYPSGEGLHVGHVRGYTAMDIVARKRRRQGENVLYPIGWDAFGLPAENYAIKTGRDPRDVTKENTDNYREQMQRLGLSFDWSHEVNTTDPSYYKWTQWIFLQLHKHGLAYKAKSAINWCPKDKIGLANEEVVDGKCERCGTPVEKREKEQWMLAITKYAERLYDDLDTVEYIERAKVGQRNWIGKSEGAQIPFRLKDKDYVIDVFTTRPDTIFGATYMVVAPEHLLLADLKETIQNWSDVETYIQEARNKEDIERTAEGKEKTGVRLEGISAINPATNEEIPVYVADYVLGSYGTGAVMAVPAHDERDFAFAKKYGLPIKQVIEPIFVQKTEPGKVREDLPFVEREAITAIIKHWSEDKYIGLRWKKVDWETLITGGVEGGQTPEEAGIAEIKEETGYQHPVFIKQLPRTHAQFFHVPKNQNRFAHFHVMYFELADGEQTKVSGEEQGNHDVVWLTKEEIGTFRLPESHRFSWDTLTKENVVYTEEGILVNSGAFDGMHSADVRKKVTETVGGTWTTKFKLRDWVFSRQRYWGEPIPMVFCSKCGWVPVPEDQLPVELPYVKAYEPTETGESPLAKMDEWVNTTCPKCGGSGKRETDVMPNWAGSSWYYLRYTDPKNSEALAAADKLQYWLPVDWYNGGMEHTTLHLLYSRFWHKFLYDIKAVPTSEPYVRRTSHGLVLAEGGEKMSKSAGNVVNPDEIVERFGADTLRVYEMFMGPFDQAIAWSTDGLVGVRRFLERVVRLKEKIGDTALSDEATTVMHQSSKKVGEDIEQLRMNTAVSQLMIYGNTLEREALIPKDAYETLLQLLAPFAPFLTEELWHELGNDVSIHKIPWPSFDLSRLVEAEVTIAVQVNGKLRGSIACPRDTDEATALGIARGEANLEKWLNGKDIMKVIYVPNRILNIIVKDG
jgi:leucyl-tRNA synthetase